jgi:synaptobrevin homolog YKT6
MVQLYAISIFRIDVKPAARLVSTQDVSSFGFFQRSTVSQFINFFSQTVAERTTPGTRSDVEENSTVGT